MKTPSAKTVWAKASEYNRRKDADSNGYVACCCCQKIMHWKDGDAGHFIPKSRGKGVYYLPANIFFQCRGCNRPYDSAQAERVKIEYTMFMVKRFGVEEVERLKKLSNQVQHNTDLSYWNAEYKRLLAELE